jgi:hypothetical protein
MSKKNGNGQNTGTNTDRHNFEKRSAQFGKPPQDQLRNLDRVLGIVKSNDGDSKKS